MKMSTSTASITPTRHRFEALVEQNKPSKMDINSVIMDYLIKEGYPEAARKFASEANIKQGAGDDESMRVRVEIKNAIFEGRIQDAIEKINELNPEILDLDESLHFSLLRLQFIEIIRTAVVNNPNPTINDVAPAIKFSTTQLAPRASINKDFLKDLEHAMSLLVFKPKELSPQINALLDPDLRREVAESVNQAILSREGMGVEARIKEWVRARSWAEQLARTGKKDIPGRIPIGLDGDVDFEEEEEPDGDAMVP